MKKILVLEDEANIRSFVVINLRRSGYEPIEAETGSEGFFHVSTALFFRMAAVHSASVRFSRISTMLSMPSAVMCS